MLGLSWWLSSKEYACNAGDTGLISELGRYAGEGNGNPLQFFVWEIPWTEETCELHPWGCRTTGQELVTREQQHDMV